MLRAALLVWLAAWAAAQTPDGAQALSERLESATPEARARLIQQEGRSDLLRAAYKSLGNRSLAYMDQVEYDKAVAACQILREIGAAFGDPQMKAAPVLTIAQAWRSEAKYSGALALLQEGLPDAVAAGNKKQQAAFLDAMGDLYRIVGREQESIDASQKALHLSEEIDDQPGIARSLASLGNAERNRGQVSAALDYYTRALRLAEAVKFDSLARTVLLSIADIYTSQHDYEIALSYLERIGPVSGSEAARKRFAGLLDSRTGYLYSRLGRPEARAILERARAENHDVKNVIEEAWDLARLGELDETSDPQSALQRYRDAAEIYHEAGIPLQESSAYAFLARLYSQLNQPAPAAEAAKRALETARQAGSPRFIGGALDELGKAYRALGRKKEAEDAFRESIRWTEDQRLEIVGTGANGASFLTDGRASPFTALMDLRAEQGDVLEAIQLSEKVRGQRLLDVMAASKVDPQKFLSEEEKQRERQLAEEAARRNAEFSRLGAPPEAKAAFEKAARDLESYQTDLYASHPRLRARRGEPQTLTPEMIQALVPDAKSLLIEYAFSEKEAWIFTIARGSEGSPVIKATRLGITPEALEKRVEQFRKSLATRDLSYKSLSASLYHDLLGPIEGELPSRSILGILPDGPLWNLPFQALTAPDGKYFIEHAAVFYAPSLGALTMASKNFRETSVGLKPLLALGAGANELPYAAQEIRALSALYGPSALTLTGAQATEDRWKQNAEQYRVIHVATHGILNTANPLYSYVQLAKTGSEDGMLEAREILDLNLRAEVVVLSACETGRGELIGGEGVVGMSWAALTAGTRTVVVSQWKVDSASTTQLMVAFHRGIAPRALRPVPIKGKAEALRRAQVELIHTPGYQHPFYWAGFEMLGEGY